MKEVQFQEDEIKELAESLVNLREKRAKLLLELEDISSNEKKVGKRIYCILQGLPVKEAARVVNEEIGRIKATKHVNKSSAMKAMWAKRTPEEKAKIQEKRRATHLAKKMGNK
jgi:hypothetical protein